MRAGNIQRLQAAAALALAALVAGCAGTGGKAVQVDPSETYRGPVGAALAPVADRTPNAGWVNSAGGPKAMQREIEAVLAGSRVFADVTSLDSPDAPNEAAALIAPTLTAADWHGTSGEVELEVRVSDTATGAVTLDRRYRGACHGCPSPAGPLAAAVKDLAEDLRKAYGRR
jgi:hypothetical protein